MKLMLCSGILACHAYTVAMEKDIGPAGGKRDAYQTEALADVVRSEANWGATVLSYPRNRVPLACNAAAEFARDDGLP